MRKPPKKSSFLTGVLNIFKSSSTQKAKNTALPARARVQEKDSKPSASIIDFPYRAAEIVVEGCSCDAVKALTGTRFLVGEVPHIPVANCTSRKCACTYLRHNDRRDKDEGRRADYSALTKAYPLIGNSERRASVGRRADDAPVRQRT